MYLSSLYLRNFRAYSEKHFSFSPHTNVIVGPNAAGKTTLLEAIHLLMTGRSFRAAQMKELIREGADSFLIEAVFIKHGIEQTLKFAYSVNERRVIYNQTHLNSLSGLLGLLQGTVLIPDDAGLIKGQPRMRRDYLDIQLAQSDPLYVHYLSRYNRAMRQRNYLLKTKNPHAIDTWENEMAKSAAYLISQRINTVAELSEIGQGLYAKLAGEGQELFCLDYQTTINQSATEHIEASYKEQLQKNRHKEMMLGSTLAGPHRDDLAIQLQSKDARRFGSEGQQRSCAVVLRLAEWERLMRRGDSIPIMLLDDVGVSLDEKRRERLTSLIQSLKQVFITSTEWISGRIGNETEIPITYRNSESNPF